MLLRVSATDEEGERSCEVGRKEISCSAANVTDFAPMRQGNYFLGSRLPD